MKILFVSAVLPYPLYSGGQVRVYNLLKELSKKHEITLLSFIRNEGEIEDAKNLDFLKQVDLVLRGRAWQPKYVLASLGKYPFLLNTYDSAEMRDKIVQLMNAEKFDGIHIEPFYVWPSLPETDLPIVVGEHNIEYEVYKSYVEHMRIPLVKQLFAYDVEKLKRWEEEVWKKVNQVITVSNEEKEIVKQFNPKVIMIPNGVDTSYFSFKKTGVIQNLTVLFVGSFRWMQNRDAVHELVTKIWPVIWKKYPKAKLRIVGKSAEEKLKALITRSGGELIDSTHDIRKEFERATVLVAPIRIGGGTSYKILEAMACGVPVLTSGLGATGLEVQDKKQLCICSSPEDYLVAVDKIMEDQGFRENLRMAARRLVEEKYSWVNIAKALDEVWEKIYGK